MSAFAAWVLERWRLSLAGALLLALAGALAYGRMPREEDPTLSDRFGLVVAAYPGADVARVERLVVRPLEEALAEVRAVREVVASARAGVAVLRVRLRDDARDLSAAWEQVDAALRAGHRELPPEAPLPELSHDLLATEAALIAVTGPADRLALRAAAEPLRRALLALPDAAMVVVSGDPGAQVAVILEDGQARRLGLSPGQVAQALAARNTTLPGGSLSLGGRTVILRPQGTLSDLEDLAQAPIGLGDGARVALGEVAEVRREQRDPPLERARLDGAPALTLGVVARRGIDALRFGAEVRRVVAQFAAVHPELTFTEVAFQPDQVRGRLAELSGALLLGVLIVALVVTSWMGLRLGLVVSAVVPLVTAGAVAVYALAGGVLHQMAVAALVIALGLLVDNAIVMGEAIQRGLDEGLGAGEAARAALAELALPLAAATGTTLAAFLPMALAVGPTAEFTAAIPQMVALSLSLSYLFALAVTPPVARWALRPARGRGRRAAGAFDRLAGRAAAAIVRRPLRALLGAGLALALAGAAAGQAKLDFFPTSDRAQVVVALELDEGASLAATDAAAQRLEAWLAARGEVTQVAAFVGRSAPFFYYNLPREPRSPQLAQLIVTTTDAAAARALVEAVHQEAAAVAPEARIIARRLEQGPPVVAPVELRLFSEDLQALRAAADVVRGLLAPLPGVVGARDTQGGGLATLAFPLADAPAARLGVTRQALAAALLGRSEGLPATVWWAERSPEPLVVRSAAGPAGAGDGEALAGVDVAAASGPVPLSQLTAARLEFQPAVIHRRDGQRTLSVLADLAAGTTHEEVVRALRAALSGVALPAGVRFAFGGATESSAEANAALGANGPLAALCLIGLLLWQFNSFRRVLIVLLTAPLAVLGIWPGLVLAGEPFGFMALLGSIALIGIVVNGAIVLIDRADRARAAGADVAEALRLAIAMRTRPILLTTLTTVAGLAPLLFSRSTLWPALAAAMISGLTVGTLLTLVVTPALYRLLFRDPTPAPRDPTPALASPGPAAKLPALPALVVLLILLILLILPGGALAQVRPGSGPPVADLEGALGATSDGVSPAEVVAAAMAAAPQARLARAQGAAARAGQAELAAARLPQVQLSARYTRLSPQTNDPLVPGPSAAELGAARAVAAQVADPAAQALLQASLDTQARLGEARVPVFVDQLALQARAIYPLTTALLTLAPRHRRLGLEAAAAEAEAEAFARVAGLAALETLYGAMEARAAGALAGERLAWAGAVRETLAARRAAGAAAEAELKAAVALEARARLAIVEAEAAEAAARADLSALTAGRIPAGLRWRAPAWPAPEALDLGGWQAEARRQRPEARALEQLLAAAEAQLEAEARSQLPELSLVAHLDTARPNPRFVPQRAALDPSWDASAVLSWSPDGFLAARARAAQARAHGEAVRARRAAFELALQRDLSQAGHARAAALARLEASGALVAAAAAALSQRQALLAEGLARPADLREAEAQHARARRDQLGAALACWRAEARLRFARGLPLVDAAAGGGPQ